MTEDEYNFLEQSGKILEELISDLEIDLKKLDIPKIFIEIADRKAKRIIEQKQSNICQK